MYIGADEGCQDVPEPIAPIDVTLVPLEPTRIAMSLPDITSRGPISIAPPFDMSMPGIVAGIFMPGVWVCGDSLGVAEGMGIFMSIFSGDAGGFGDGELVGICIPGICVPGVWVCGDSLGVAEGMGIFRSIFSGDAGGLGDGELVGICIPGMLLMSCFFCGCVLFRTKVLFLLDALRRFTFAFAFGFDFGLGLLMPGMLLMSCCENAVGPVANEIKTQLNKNRYL
jgi:hypothetical protein